MFALRKAQPEKPIINRVGIIIEIVTMEKKVDRSFSRFEVLNETALGSLVGGFSAVFTAAPAAELAGANNCDGGNCKVGCGSGQNIGACNSLPGCGVKL